MHTTLNNNINQLVTLDIMQFPFKEKIYDGDLFGSKPQKFDSYYQYDFDTIESFINAISPSSPIYKSKIPSNSYDFLFRGHKLSTWELKPSRYRENPKINNGKSNPLQYWQVKSDNERRELALFIKNIDRIGYDINQESLLFSIKEIQGYRYGNHPLDKNRIIWFKKELLSSMALAQHYDIKTRLLDWTYNPLIAVFFAVIGAIDSSEFKNIAKNNDKDSQQRIGVWLFPEALLQAAKLINRIDYIEIPKKNNNNMKAQQGIFINYIDEYFPNNLSYIQNGESNIRNRGSIMPPTHDDIHKFGMNSVIDENMHIIPLNNYLMKELDDEILLPVEENINGIKNNINKNFYRDVVNLAGPPRLFTLSWNHLKDLYDYLDKLNINYTTIFPSLEGAAKQVNIDKIFCRI